jgi:hypothetical protein
MDAAPSKDKNHGQQVSKLEQDHGRTLRQFRPAFFS